MSSPQNPWQQPSGYPPQAAGGTGPHPVPQSGPLPQAPNPYAAPPAPTPPRVPRPKTVEAAFWIAVAVPLLAVIFNVLSFFLAQKAVDQAFRQEAATDEYVAEVQDGFSQLAQGLVFGVSIFVTVLMLILTALWILFGFKMRAGRNWARVVLTIFAAIWLLNVISGLASGLGTGGYGSLEDVEMPTSFLVVTVLDQAISGLGMIAFLVLVYLKPSNWYFNAARQA